MLDLISCRLLFAFSISSDLIVSAVCANPSDIADFISRVFVSACAEILDFSDAAELFMLSRIADFISSLLLYPCSAKLDFNASAELLILS